MQGDEYENKKVLIDDLIVSQNMVVDVEEITGLLRIENNVKFVASKLKRVGGYLNIYSNAELDAPKLETVGGYLNIYSNAELTAAKLRRLALIVIIPMRILLLLIFRRWRLLQCVQMRLKHETVGGD